MKNYDSTRIWTQHCNIRHLTACIESMRKRVGSLPVQIVYGKDSEPYGRWWTVLIRVRRMVGREFMVSCDIAERKKAPLRIHNEHLLRDMAKHFMVATDNDLDELVEVAERMLRNAKAQTRMEMRLKEQGWLV